MLPESQRLEEDARREKNWKRWGPYLSDRQWATVREDYSEYGDVWNSFPHDHARSRAYRWGEDGLLGLCDRECRLCFGLALWNGNDTILKERLFGLTNGQGNHGEDVKELYYYLESSPTHSWMRALYKYPHSAFPYAQLVSANAAAKDKEDEVELTDLGTFDAGHFDVMIDYAKGGPNDILVRVTVTNHGPAAKLVVLPQVWFKNNWTWGCVTEAVTDKPNIRLAGDHAVTDHKTLEPMHFHAEAPAEWVFTDNETNHTRLGGMVRPKGWYYKDAFHEYVVDGKKDAVCPDFSGTKAGAIFRIDVPADGTATVRLRLCAEAEAPGEIFGDRFDDTMNARRAEYKEHLRSVIGTQDAEQYRVAEQAVAGLLWSKQFYHYAVREWLDGDSKQPAPPPEREKRARNREWKWNLYNRDVISMPDKWEYPWYASWDLAFHMIIMARVDPQFAKDQLLLFLREWYMHPSGQLPAYEFNFSDVNPPVHAWACWRIYKMTGEKGKRDRDFLERTFQKLMLNFTWWVNRKDFAGKNIFGGGFLGLDNIGLFDRNQPLPTGGRLEQADGTAWMAFFCGIMLSMAIELASEDIVYEDVASKFFEHFIAIVDATHRVGGTGLWDEPDGFYYDQIFADGKATKLKVRSLVGIIPTFAVEVLESDVVHKLPGFKKRLEWFLTNRESLKRYVTLREDGDGQGKMLLAVPNEERLKRILNYVLDENEFLSPHGIRSLSRVHAQPYTFRSGVNAWSISYEPGHSHGEMFGGNSNWRGPVWFPVNFLLIEALEQYHYFYGDAMQVECPKGSGTMMNLRGVADELRRRMISLFLPDAKGRRPCHGRVAAYAADPAFKNLLQYHEFFHGDTGEGLGASHQTGWTALVAEMIR